MSIECDFIDDYKKILIKYGRDKKIRLPENDDKAVIRVLTFLRKRGSAKNKQIKIAKPINIPKYCRRVVLKLLRAIKNGEDISPYMSKKAFKEKKTDVDLMFSAWNILHLHLGSELENNGQFIKRTNELLFLLLQDEIVYVIGVYNHSRDIWFKRDIIQRIYDNWPELFYELEGIDNIDTYSDEEYKVLRQNHGNVLLTVYDKNADVRKVVVPMTLGMVASGDSSIDVVTYDKICVYLLELQNKILGQIKKSTDSKNERITLTLRYIDSKWVVIYNGRRFELSDISCLNHLNI